MGRLPMTSSNEETGSDTDEYVDGHVASVFAKEDLTSIRF